MHHDPTQVTLDEIPTYLLRKLYKYFQDFFVDDDLQTFYRFACGTYNAMHKHFNRRSQLLLKSEFRSHLNEFEFERTPSPIPIVLYTKKLLHV